MMNENSILSTVTAIISETLDIDKVSLTQDTAVKDVREWDSAAHALIASLIEKNFGTRFSMAEIVAFKRIGDIVDCLKRKLA